MEIKRLFAGTSTEMFTSIDTLVNNMITKQAFLVTKNTTLTVPFFTTLKSEINTTRTTYLGVDTAASLRSQTTIVKGIMKPIHITVSFVKSQIENLFDPDTVAEYLNTLGFKDNWKRASRKDQEAMIDLLVAFSHNLTTAINTALTTAGIPTATISQITDAGEELYNANQLQEGTKITAPTVNAATLTIFNTLYKKIIRLSNIATRAYVGDKTTQSLFSYTKILRNLQGTSLTTVFEGDITINGNSSYTIPGVQITAKARILTKTDGTQIYFCRNSAGCPPASAFYNIPDQENTFGKEELPGPNKFLTANNLSATPAVVYVRIRK